MRVVVVHWFSLGICFLKNTPRLSGWELFPRAPAGSILSPLTNRERVLSGALNIAKSGIRIAAAGCGIVAVSPKPSRALSYSLDDTYYSEAPLNKQADDFWFPPYLLGTWNMNLTFQGGTFSKSIPLDVLAKDENVPGFSKYSVIFVPEIGRSIANVPIKFVDIDSHPREDHSYNIRQRLNSFFPDAVVDSAPYAYQKAPTTLRSPANRWHLEYHDAAGRGSIDLFTRKRNITVYAGGFETIEFIRQTHSRLDNKGRPVGKKLVGDYAMNWRLAVPAALKDQFVTVDDLRKTDTLVGTLDVLVYLQPTNDLYFKVPGKPAGVFSYEITLDRRKDPTGSATRGYPFVWRADGPVELQEYFGY